MSHLAQIWVEDFDQPPPDGYLAWLVVLGSEDLDVRFGAQVHVCYPQADELNKAVVGMAATSDGAGYWLVASDGGVSTFGGAGFVTERHGEPMDEQRQRSSQPPGSLVTVIASTQTPLHLSDILRTVVPFGPGGRDGGPQTVPSHLMMQVLGGNGDGGCFLFFFTGWSW